VAACVLSTFLTPTGLSDTVLFGPPTQVCGSHPPLSRLSDQLAQPTIDDEEADEAAETQFPTRAQGHGPTMAETVGRVEPGQYQHPIASLLNADYPA
jgi:hypothetical protein